ncbi:hypothetical protein I4U23_005564 [Adineta vaga]|nr:hypothetical protein I4U23_005564 [Adineta vaga]
MIKYSSQRIFVLLITLLGLTFQCIAVTVYTCANETTSCGCSKRIYVILKIGGGESAVLNKWNWIVSLRDTNQHFCGGSIVNEWYIITAAHCLNKRQNFLSRITVCAGTFRLSDSCRQQRAIDSIVLHPSYNDETFENDIALIRLFTPLDFSDTKLTPICLPEDDRPEKHLEIGRKVVAIGWGRVNTNFSSNELQQATFKIRDQSSIHCKHVSNSRLQLCAGGRGKNSSGPLMTLTALKRWELIGLSSFTQIDANYESGGGFTFIAPFLQFIRTHTQAVMDYRITKKPLWHCPQGSHLNNTNITQYSQASCTYISRNIFIYNNGDTYEGETKDGKKHGRGTYNRSNGNTYQGDWLNDKLAGQGIYTWMGGDRYIGDWVDNRKTGYGIMTWPNEGQYIGLFQNDMFRGRGIRVYANGDEYIGDFIDGGRIGRGTFTWSSGDQYHGDWLADSRIGQCIYI